MSDHETRAAADLGFVLAPGGQAVADEIGEVSVPIERLRDGSEAPPGAREGGRQPAGACPGCPAASRGPGAGPRDAGA